LLRADRAWDVQPRAGDPARANTSRVETSRVRTGLVASGAVHALLGVALSAAVWHAVPEQPVSSALTMVFEAPPDQQQTAAPQPTPEAATPTQPEPPQPEPPQPELAAAVPEPVEAAPVVPAADPTPEPPPPPPPPAVESPPVQPPPVPHARPQPRQIVARPQVARPMAAKPGPAAVPPAEPVPSAPGASAPPAAQPESPAAVGWNSLFSAWLASRKTYPEVARRRGEQGSVTLRFKVAGDGTVLNVALLTGSGSPVLDEAARALLRDAKLPPPQTEIDRTVRLRYRLDD
jgi:protein TonB